MSRILKLFVAVLVGASVLVLVPSTALAANPATDDAESFCEVIPEFSTGVQNGVSSVAPGETVVVQNRVVFGAGDVFQDIVVEPDGTVFYASWVQVDLSVSGVEFGSVTPSLSFNGVPVPFTAGVAPAPDGYVFDAGLNRMYLPGDPAVIDNGVGEVSISTVAGDELVVSYSGVVTSLEAGTAELVADCSFSLASGDSNRTEAPTSVFIGISGLEVGVSKLADPTVAVGGQTVTYTVVVSNPLLTVDSFQAGPAFNVVVNDSYDAGLLGEPVVTSGNATVVVGAAGSAAFTIGRIDAGESVTLTYEQVVDVAAAAGAVAVNTAAGSATSAPDPAGTYTVPFVGSPVEETVAVSSETPELTKSVSQAVAGEKVSIDYSVEVVIPAGSVYSDAVFFDVIPDGFQTFVGAVSADCGVDVCPTGIALANELDAVSGEQRVGVYYESITVGATPLTITYTYSLTTGTMLDDDLVLGQLLDNTAGFGFYSVPTLGGVLPLLGDLPDFDGSVTDSESVTFARPIIALDKEYAGSVPVSEDEMANGVPYTVTVTNTGNAVATDVEIADTNANGWGIDAASVVNANYVSPGRFRIPTIAAGDTVVVSYRLLLPAGTTADDVIDNTARVQNYSGASSEFYGGGGVTDTAEADLVFPRLEVDKSSVLPVYSTAAGSVLSYEVVIRNVSDRTAFNPTVVDRPSSSLGGFTPQNLVCSPAAGWTLTDKRFQFEFGSATPILAGDSVTCTYDVVLDRDRPARAYTNGVVAEWEDVLGSSSYNDATTGQLVEYTTTAAASATLVDPKLSIQKFPNVADDAPILQNGDSLYRVVIVNTGSVPVTGAVFADTLPTGLDFIAGNDPSVSLADDPSGTTSAAVLTVAGDDLDITWATIAPGARITVLIPVSNDGTGVVGGQYDNVASIDFDNNTDGAALSDDGTLFFVPVIDPPTSTKTVDPTSALVDELVEFTVVMDVPVNGVDVFDVTFRDTLPDGLEFVAFATTPAGLVEVAPIVDPVSGVTYFGYFADDVVAATGPLTYTATYTARVLETLSTGSPVTSVPLTNVVQPFANVGAGQFDAGNLPAINQGSVGQFNIRGVRETAVLDVNVPVIEIAKVLTSHPGPDTWTGPTGATGDGYFVDVAEQLGYEVTVTNTGNAPAFAVDFVDDMAQGDLTNIVYSVTLPGGTSTTTVANDIDSPTDADGIGLQFDVIEPGESVVITYTGDVPDSPVLLPGLSGANYDVGLVDNTADVTRFQSTAAGGYVFTTVGEAVVDVFVITPIAQPSLGLCFEPTGLGQNGSGTITVRNNVNDDRPLTTVGWPLRDGPGVLYSPQVQLIISTDVAFTGIDGSFDPPSVRSRRDNDFGQQPIPAFTAVDNGDGTQTISIDLPDLEQADEYTLFFGLVSSKAGSYGGNLVVSGTDAAGNSRRGDAVGADFVYSEDVPDGCQQVPTITKLPDNAAVYPGDTQTWNGTFLAARGQVPVDLSLALSNIVLTDILPAGVTFTPNTAEFTVTDGTGTVTTVTTAAAEVTETVTPLADGRTEIVFTSPGFASVYTLDWSFDTVIDADIELNELATNSIDATYTDDVDDRQTCAGPDPFIQRVCDTGSVIASDTRVPLINKTIDQSENRPGDELTFTIDVTIPANSTTLFDTGLVDDLSGMRSYALNGGQIGTLTCVSGCLATDPALQPYPFTSNGDRTAAWFIGDLAPNTNNRVYQWILPISLRFANDPRWVRGGSVSPFNHAYVNHNRNNEQPGSPPDGLFADWDYGDINVESRTRLRITKPAAFREKVCGSPGGTADYDRNELRHSEPGVPNWRCVLTFETSGASGEEPVLDGFTMSELFPVDAALPYPVDYDVQIISRTADDAANWTFVDIPAAVANDPAAVQAVLDGFTGEYVAPLRNGDTVEIVLDLRLTAFDPGTADVFDWSVGDGSIPATNKVTLDTIIDPFVGPLVVGRERSSTDELGPYTASINKQVWRAAQFDNPDRINLDHGFRNYGCFVAAAQCDTGTLGVPGAVVNNTGQIIDVVPGERLTYTLNVSAAGASGLRVDDFLPPGYEYIADSARLFTTTLDGPPFYDARYVPLNNPVVTGAASAVDCSTAMAAPVALLAPSYTDNNVPWHERGGQSLSWTFTDTGDSTDPSSANWYAELSSGTEVGNFTIVFDVDTSGASACADTATGSNVYKNIAEVIPTWPLQVAAISSTDAAYSSHLAADVVTKLPLDGFAADGTTANFTINVEVRESAGFGALIGNFSPDCPAFDDHDLATSDRDPALPPYDEVVPCVGRDEAERLRNATYNSARLTPRSFGAPSVQSRLSVPVRTVTDTFIDDGLYVDGSATVQGLNSWGEPVAATNIVSEEVVRGVDAATGRANVTIVWTLDEVPFPVEFLRWKASSAGDGFMFPSSVQITVPLDIPVDTVDGYQYFNSAFSTLTTDVCFPDGAGCDSSGGAGVNTIVSPVVEAVITVVNPSPPVVGKSADPAVVAPGGVFTWNLSVELDARRAWFDLAISDSLPLADFEIITVGDVVCTETVAGTPCVVDVPVADLLVGADGTNTNIYAFFDDVQGESFARTLNLPVTVRNISGAVSGDVLGNTIEGFSNDENLVDTLVGAPSGVFTDEVEAEVTVVEPVLEIDKVVTNLADGPFVVGDTISWELTVTNTGTGPAINVAFDDRPDTRVIAPASAAVVPSLSKNYTAQRPWMTWFYPTIAVGESVTVAVSGTVTAGYEALGLVTADNDATVTGYFSGPPLDTATRRYDQVSDEAQAPLVAPGIEIAKFGGDCVSPANVFDVGQSVPWCLEVSNPGVIAASNAVVQDSLPVGWSFDTTVPALWIDGVTEIDLAAYTTIATVGGAEQVTFDLNTAGETPLGDLAAGGVYQITYNTVPGPQTTVLNRAVVRTTTADGSAVPGTPDGYFASATAPAAAVDQGLEIIKTVQGNPADPDLYRQECDFASGCAVVWDIVVINTEQSRLSGVTMVDSVPATLEITNVVSPVGWTPVVGAVGAGAGGTTVVTWTLTGEFAANAAAAFSIETNVPANPDDRRFLNTAVADSVETEEVQDQAAAETFTIIPASVGDYVWLDDDVDGVQDPDEPGIEGVVVNLIDDTGAIIDTTTTDSTGFYLFPVVAPGTYTIEFIAPPNLSPVPNGLGGDTELDSDRLTTGSTAPFTLDPGQNKRDIDSGWYVINSAIGIVKHVNGVDANTAPGVEVTTGDTVTFTYDITNTGDVGLVNVSLSDDIEGDIACPQASLSVGETMTCTVTAVAITGQYTNIGTVTADSDVVEGFDSSTVTADASANYLGSTTPTPSTSTPSTSTPSTSSPRGPTPPDSTPPDSTQPDSTQPVSTQPVSTPSGPLSLTGANSGFLVLLGGLLVAGGAILVVVSRRRSRHESVQV